MDNQQNPLWKIFTKTEICKYIQIQIHKYTYLNNTDKK